MLLQQLPFQSRKDPNVSVGKGLLLGLVEDLEELLAASLVRTSSCVGKVCASHRNQVVPPIRLLLSTNQPQAAQHLAAHPHSPHQETPQVPPLATTGHQTRAALVPPTLISSTYQVR